MQQTEVRAGSYDSTTDRGVPVARRARRRYYRRMRIASSIEPLRGAPKAQVVEGIDWGRCDHQEEVGPLARGPGGPNRSSAELRFLSTERPVRPTSAELRFLSPKRPIRLTLAKNTICSLSPSPIFGNSYIRSCMRISLI